MFWKWFPRQLEIYWVSVSWMINGHIFAALQFSSSACVLACTWEKKNGIPRVVHSHRLRWSMRHHSLFLCFLYLKCAFSNSVNEVNSPLEKNKYCFRYACAWCLMKPDVLLCQTFHLIVQELSTLQKLWCVIYLMVWHDSAASVAFVFTAGSQTLIRD